MQLSAEKKKKKKTFGVASQLTVQDFTPSVAEPPSGATSQELSHYMTHASHIVSCFVAAVIIMEL
jgi:hypothetical protein